VGAVTLEYAGLARGEDPAIAVAVADLARTHEQSLAGEGWSAVASTAPDATATAPVAPTAPAGPTARTGDDAHTPA
jgi:cytochrome c biogenesis protein